MQGTIGSVEPDTAVLGERRLPTDPIVLAIGWAQGLAFLPAAVRNTLVEADGPHRLYQSIVNPDVPHLAFVPVFRGRARGNAGEGRDCARYRFPHRLAPHRPPVAAGYGGRCVAPFHHVHFSMLMAEMGDRTRPANPLVASPLHSATRYARLLASPSLNPVPKTAA